MFRQNLLVLECKLLHRQFLNLDHQQIQERLMQD